MGMIALTVMTANPLNEQRLSTQAIELARSRARTMVERPT
jgi:hypothetical protein